MELKSALGLAAVLLALVSYVPYIRNVLRDKTKPHALSWLVWSILAAIACAVQVLNDAGPGAWLTALTAVATLTVFCLSLKKGEANILLIDWLSLLFAAVALVLWFFTKNPLTSVVIISIIDLVGGFIPTFRKSYRKPYQETVSIYFIYALALGLSLAALNKFDLVNALYPASFILVNGSMAIFLTIRRSQLSPRSDSQPS